MAAKFPLDPRVTVELGELAPELRRTGERLRRVIRKNAPSLKECMKWGNPVWVGNDNALCLMLYANHLNLGFFRGAELRKTFPEIEGTGKNLRHIRVRSVEHARDPLFPRAIRAAVRLDTANPRTR